MTLVWIELDELKSKSPGTLLFCQKRCHGCLSFKLNFLVKMCSIQFILAPQLTPVNGAWSSAKFTFCWQSRIQEGEKKSLNSISISVTVTISYHLLFD